MGVEFLGVGDGFGADEVLPNIRYKQFGTLELGGEDGLTVQDQAQGLRCLLSGSWLVHSVE